MNPARRKPRELASRGPAFLALSHLSGHTVIRCSYWLQTTIAPCGRPSSGRFSSRATTLQLASDGDAALAAIAERTPDAVVLDVMMPGYDGLDVTRRLRREGNRVPVLLLTARDAVGDRVEGLDAGADDYLPKPFALEELLARLRALLRRSLEAEPADVLRFADLTFDSARWKPAERAAGSS